MSLLTQNRFYERVFVGVILLTLASFAYYFTAADLEEIQVRFLNRRIVLIKLLAREISDLLSRDSELTPRLSNLLAEESVAYALVQQGTGEILAKAENNPISVGTLSEVESKALQASFLKFEPFMDPSQTLPMCEGVMPLFTEGGRKVLLRIGFFRLEEEEKIRQVRFRNILMFSVLFLAFLTYWVVNKRRSSHLMNTWMGGAGLLILLVFMSTRFTLQDWYDRHWRQTYAQHGMEISKVLGLSAKRFLMSGDENDLRNLQNLLEIDESFAFLGVIKDDQYLFHSDSSLKGKPVGGDRNYAKSLNSEHPFLTPIEEDELYEVFVPLIDGQHRLGTLRLGLRNPSGYGPLAILRNRMTMIFLATLVVGLFLVYLLARRISKEVGAFISAMENVTAGDLRQQIYIDRSDEFGQMSQSFNFMLMSLRERDMLGKGLQQYVSKSIVDKTLRVLTAQEKNGEKIFAVSLFVYFSGLNEAIHRINSPEIFGLVRETFKAVRQVCPPSQNCHILHHLSGILVLFTNQSRHEALMETINAAQLLIKALAKIPETAFSPRLTVHSLESVHGALDEEGQNLVFVGEGLVDFRAFSQIQDVEELLLSEETSYLLKDVANLDQLEIGTSEQRKVRGFVFRGFRSGEELVKAFPEATAWAKTLILKILKGYARVEDAPLLLSWFSDPDPGIRFHVMETLERLKPPGIIDFVVKVVQEETDVKVLSKAIGVLGKIGNENHIPVLAEKLRLADRRVKANAIEALEGIGGKKVYEFLNLLVDEQDNRVKANILIALGKYGDLKVFDLLSRMIRDPDKNMRASAAFALGRLGMAQGVEPLIQALSDKDIAVRRQVVASLTSLKADLEIEM